MYGLALLCIGLEVKCNTDETLKQVQGDVKLVKVIGRIVQITGN